jgi:type I restriction enzyme S subunit
MVVKKGYKQTNVGVIPEDWESVRLGSIASFKSGIGIEVSKLDSDSSHANIPVFGGNGIAGYTTRSMVSESTLVIGRVGQKCGEVYLTNGPAWITDNALFPRALSGKVIIKYLAIALRGAGLNSFKNRNDLPLVTQTILDNVTITLPPTLAEQEAIASVLSDADAWIESLEQLIVKKRQIKQGAMQELLTGKRRLPGFSGKWETKRLGEIGIFLKGSGVRKHEASSGEIPCVRYGEIYTYHDDYVRRFNSSISHEVAETATRLNYGDLLFAGSGETKAEIGKCVAFAHTLAAYAGGDIVILRSVNIDPIFMGYYCNTRHIAEQKAARGQGDAVVHISSSALASIQICIPEIHEQTAIATVLSDMDTEIESLESKLAKALEIKQGMMQELLTGKTRL